MTTSRYEKYIVRKPAVWTTQPTFGAKGKAEVPAGKIPVRGSYASSTSPLPETGALIMWSPILKEGTKQLIEYGIITGDCTVGDSAPGNFEPRKSYGEGIYFLIMGTNPEDLSDLGGEAELWLGEGEELEKVVIDTPSCVYCPPGLARFPLTWKNVKRPILMAVFSPRISDDEPIEPVSLEGRPMYKP